MATPPESPLSTPWSSRPPSRLDSQGGTSRPETPYSEYTNASRPRTPAPLVRRLVAVAARRENAEFVAGLGFLLVLLVAFFFELTDHDAAVKWSTSRAAGVLGSGVGGQVGAASLQDVCTCSHAEAGLRAAMRACAGRVDSKEGELVQALTLQTAAQAEAVSSLETRLQTSEEARVSAEAAASEARAKEETATLKCGSDARTAAGKSRLHAALAAAQKRAVAAEAAAAAATAAAEDATRTQQRLQARLTVAEAELGLLTAERALAQTKLTVSEETLVVATAQCSGSSAFNARADALRAAAAADAAAATAAVERARAAVADSVRRADAAFATSAKSRAGHAKDALWRSRTHVGLYNSAASASGGDTARRVGGLPNVRRKGRWLIKSLLFGCVRLLWRLRFVGLLLLLGAGIIHVQTGSEEVNDGTVPGDRRPPMAQGPGTSTFFSSRAAAVFSVVSAALATAAGRGRAGGQPARPMTAAQRTF